MATRVAAVTAALAAAAITHGADAFSDARRLSAESPMMFINRINTRSRSVAVASDAGARRRWNRAAAARHTSPSMYVPEQVHPAAQIKDSILSKSVSFAKASTKRIPPDTKEWLCGGVLSKVGAFERRTSVRKI